MGDGSRKQVYSYREVCQNVPSISILAAIRKRLSVEAIRIE